MSLSVGSYLAWKEMWRNRGRFFLVSLVIALIIVLPWHLYLFASQEGAFDVYFGTAPSFAIDPDRDDVEVIVEDDDVGRSMSFRINGRDVFAKGANWIPADSFPTRLTDAHLERLVRERYGIRALRRRLEHSLLGYGEILERQAEIGDVLRRRLREEGWIVVLAECEMHRPRDLGLITSDATVTISGELGSASHLLTRVQTGHALSDEIGYLLPSDVFSCHSFLRHGGNGLMG